MHRPPPCHHLGPIRGQSRHTRSATQVSGTASGRIRRNTTTNLQPNYVAEQVIEHIIYVKVGLNESRFRVTSSPDSSWQLHRKVECTNDSTTARWPLSSLRVSSTPANPRGHPNLPKAQSLLLQIENLLAAPARGKSLPSRRGWHLARPKLRARPRASPSSPSQPTHQRSSARMADVPPP